MENQKCPVCGSSQIERHICTNCRFDFSADAEQYETFAQIPRRMSVAGQRQDLRPETHGSRKPMTILIPAAVLAVVTALCFMGFRGKTSPDVQTQDVLETAASTAPTAAEIETTAYTGSGNEEKAKKLTERENNDMKIAVQPVVENTKAMTGNVTTVQIKNTPSAHLNEEEKQPTQSYQEDDSPSSPVGTEGDTPASPIIETSECPPAPRVERGEELDGATRFQDVIPEVNKAAPSADNGSSSDYSGAIYTPDTVIEDFAD